MSGAKTNWPRSRLRTMIRASARRRRISGRRACYDARPAIPVRTQARHRSPGGKDNDAYDTDEKVCAAGPAPWVHLAAYERGLLAIHLGKRYPPLRWAKSTKIPFGRCGTGVDAATQSVAWTGPRSNRDTDQQCARSRRAQLAQGTLDIASDRIPRQRTRRGRQPPPGPACSG